MVRMGLVLVLLVGNAYASSELELREKQKELVVMLEQILNRHLGMTGYELEEVDSDTSFVVQVFYPRVYTPRLLGQAGVFLRSLKITFNEMYLYDQENIAAKNKQKFVLQNAKKMHLRFIPAEEGE